MRELLARLARRGRYEGQTEICGNCGSPKYKGQACPGCGAC